MPQIIHPNFYFQDQFDVQFVQLLHLLQIDNVNVDKLLDMLHHWHTFQAPGKQEYAFADSLSKMAGLAGRRYLKR